MSSSSFSSLFALVVGIDKYSAKSTHALSGAVADARAIKSYLTDNLRVPERNITTLLDYEATRSQIIKGLENLAESSEIKEWDPILFFFAGHGAEGAPPENWDIPGSKVEMIIPYDFYDNIPGDPQAYEMRGILDRSIGVLLEKIARKKKNNIVVILDCCHAGSGTRDGDRRLRCLEKPVEISGDLANEIWGPIKESKEKATEATTPDTIEHETPEENGNKRKENLRALIAEGCEYDGEASHVLLAACASNQRAYESGGRGAFTKALLNTMSTIGIQEMTYSFLIRQLPQLPGQTPRCEGTYKNRILFSKKDIQVEPLYEVDQRDDEFWLKAGGVHGITKGSEFSLYTEPNTASKKIGDVTVTHVGDLESIIEFPSGPPDYRPMPAYAFQTSFGQAQPLRIYVSDDSRLARLRTRLEKEVNDHSRLYALVADREKARFEITAYREPSSYISNASFAFINSSIDAEGLKRLPFFVSLEEKAEEIVVKVIDAAYVFNRYLTYQPLDVKTPEEPVYVHFARLRPVAKEQWRPWIEMTPLGNLNLNNWVELVNGQDIVGMHITNQTDECLYPYLFLFNCNELTIEPWYTSPTVKGPDNDAPLQPRGSMTLGFDATTGGRPWRHVVKPSEKIDNGTIYREKEDREVEYFKLILTTQPVDFGFIKLATPFTVGPRAVPQPIPLEMRKSVLFTVVTHRTEPPRK